MGFWTEWNWSLDGWIVAVGVLASVAAALLGNFLVLRRMSMLGDAISHAILPGLAVSFLISGSRSNWPMFVGAVLVGLLTAFLTECLRGWGQVDEGASMGVVFTSLFALGLIMIVQAADHVDLDPNCVLYGAIELTPLDTWTIGPWHVPRVAVILTCVLLLNLALVVMFFKELTISAFDPGLAASAGIPPRLFHYALMTLVAVTAVASFEAVGNILVVAMFVVPPATAYLLTDRLSRMVVLSTILAAMAAALGHVAAIEIPAWFGLRSTTTAGMMTVAAGLMFAVAFCFAPRYGVIVKSWRNWRLAQRILAEDVIGILYRAEERGAARVMSINELASVLVASRTSLAWIVRLLAWRNLLASTPAGLQLTQLGRDRAGDLIRSHRLWEQYLVNEAHLPPDQIHRQAEVLEHFTGSELQRQLNRETLAPQVDPHGSPIPPPRTTGQKD